MSTEIKPETPQVEGKRYCPDCNTQVTHDAEICPSCKKALYASGRSSWQAELIGFLWGAIMMSIWIGIIVFIFGPSESKTFYTFEKIVGVSIFYLAWRAKAEELKARRDIAVWKSDNLSESDDSVSRKI